MIVSTYRHHCLAVVFASISCRLIIAAAIALLGEQTAACEPTEVQLNFRLRLPGLCLALPTLAPIPITSTGFTQTQG